MSEYENVDWYSKKDIKEFITETRANQRRIFDKVKKRMIAHINSDTYLKRLVREFDSDENKAKE